MTWLLIVLAFFVGSWSTLLAVLCAIILYVFADYHSYTKRMNSAWMADMPDIDIGTSAFDKFLRDLDAYAKD